MGKSEADKPGEADDEEFDPWLGLVLGDTRWKIGKNFANILNIDGEKRTQNRPNASRVFLSPNRAIPSSVVHQH